jgi:pyruvate,water dikinase
MVEPRKSGVLLTVDPVQGRRDRMVVEAIFGLGEQVVSGEVTPDHYVVDRSGVAKRERLTHGGVLEPDELVRLANLGRTLEERFGGPQDIEWAIADGELYLLQSRPVTTP